MSNKHIKRRSVPMSLVIKGTEIKITMRRHFVPTEVARMTKPDSLSEAGRNCPPIAAGNGRWGGLCEKQLRRQLNTELPRDQQFYAQVHPQEE